MIEITVMYEGLTPRADCCLAEVSSVIQSSASASSSYACTDLAGGHEQGPPPWLQPAGALNDELLAAAQTSVSCVCAPI